MDKILVLLLCFYSCSAKIRINHLDVPSAIRFGSRNDVVLDCSFDTGGDTATELKWFLNGNTLIYQWLSEYNVTGKAAPKFKGHVDENYRLANDESMHWPLHITDLTPEFSGNYTCKVSSPFSEDERTKRMIIYVSPDDDGYDDDDDEDDDDDDDDDDSDLLDVTVSKETLEITCSSGGFFPQPNLTLYIATNDNNSTEIVSRQDDETLEMTDTGLYNVTATLTFDANLTQNFIYVCELNIPGTTYNISKDGTFLQEDDSAVRVEEDYLDLVNATNSTESSFEELQEIETQVEETPETTLSIDDGDVTTEEPLNLNENASWKHLPSLVPTVVMVALLALLDL